MKSTSRDTKTMIMISYARENPKTMIAFRDAFLAEGVQVWTDRNIIRGSQNWQREVQSAIDACNGHCVLLSPPAKNSSWVGQEIAYSQAQKKKIFPVRIYGTVGQSVPLALSTAQMDSIAGLEGLERSKKIKRIVAAIVKAL